MATERDELQYWLDDHQGEQMDAELAAKCPPCEGWYPIVDDYLILSGDMAEASDTRYTLVSDQLGCVQLRADRRYLLMARYVSKDIPLRLYRRLPDACAVAMDLHGDYLRMRDTFPEVVRWEDGADFCGFEVLLVREDGTVGLPVETFDREPDAI
jgi:hypothetical protein